MRIYMVNIKMNNWDIVSTIIHKPNSSIPYLVCLFVKLESKNNFNYIEKQFDSLNIGNERRVSRSLRKLFLL